MSKFDESRTANLIGGFYEAAARPDLWRGLLAEMADAVGALGCGLTPGPDSPLHPICSASLDEIVAVGRTNGLLYENPRMYRGVQALQLSPQNVVTEAMLFSPWELDHLPFHAEYVNRFELRHFAGMVVAGDNQSGLAFSAERTARQGPFSASEVETLRRMVPHIQRAGQLALHLAAARHDGVFDALAMFDCGALLLDWRGRVLRLNTKAEALMGAWLSIRCGWLTATHKACDSALGKLIASVIAHGPTQEMAPVGAVAIARPGSRPLAVHASPVTRSAKDLFQQASAVLMIVDPDTSRVPLETLLCQAFRFTGAEAMIAIGLCGGSDVDEIAQMRGVSTATVRAQIKAMFLKTNTRRQAELVALLLRYAPIAG